MSTKNEIDKWKGLKIMIGGIALGFSGFAVLKYFEHNSGYLIFLSGWLIALFGFVIHIKQFPLGLSAEQKELFKKAKQPWEK